MGIGPEHRESRTRAGDTCHHEKERPRIPESPFFSHLGSRGRGRTDTPFLITDFESNQGVATGEIPLENGHFEEVLDTVRDAFPSSGPNDGARAGTRGRAIHVLREFVVAAAVEADLDLVRILSDALRCLTPPATDAEVHDLDAERARRGK